MRHTTKDETLAAALQAMMRDAAPVVVAEAFNEARSEVTSILRRRFVDALLEEAGHQAESPARTERVDPPEEAIGTARAQGQASGRHATSRRRTPRGAGAGSAESALVERGVYLYGFAAQTVEPPAGLTGIGGSRIYRVAEADLAAIVSDVSGQRHRWGVDANGEPDLALLAPRLEAHERVLESLLEHGTVLPMRFGTLYSSSTAIRQVLHDHGPAIGGVLDRLDGKVEWGLTVTWDSTRLDDQRSGDEALVAPAVSQAPGSPGRAYLSRREAFRERTEWLARHRAAVAAELHRAVDEVAAASVIEPRRREKAEADGADTLLKASYLVDGAARDRFEAVIVERLEAGAELGLRGELTGPWPPYHFSSVELEGARA